MARLQHGGTGGRGRVRPASGLVCLVVAALAACTSTPDGPAGSPGVTLTSPGSESSAGASPEATAGAAEPTDAPPAGGVEPDGSEQPADPDPADPEPAGPSPEVEDPFEPLASVKRDRATAVPLDATSAPRPDVVARVVEVDEVRGEAVLPGETTGPALQVTVELDNEGDQPLDLRGAVVNLYTGKARTPATILSGPGAEPLPADLPPDGSARGTVVFRVDDPGALLEIELDIADAPTIVVFRGRA